MSDTIFWAVYWFGWWCVLVALVALDMSNKTRNLHDCWWPCGVLIGWTWPFVITAFIAVYLPAKAIQRWFK